MKLGHGFRDELCHLGVGFVFHTRLTDGEVGDVGPALQLSLGEQTLGHRPHAVEVVRRQFVVCDEPINVDAAHLHFVAVAVPERSGRRQFHDP